MRYLSDDGKVFNTADECKEYEANKKKNDEREEERKSFLQELRKKYVSLLNDINDWLEDYNYYLDKYPEKRKAGKKDESYFSLDQLLDFLSKTFEEIEEYGKGKD